MGLKNDVSESTFLLKSVCLIIPPAWAVSIVI